MALILEEFNMREIDESKYVEEIKKLKRKRRIIICFHTVVLIALVAFSSPIEFEFMGNVIEHQGIGIVLTIVLMIACSFIVMIAHAIVLAPLNNSMLQECEPEKNLAINKALNKSKNRNAFNFNSINCYGNYIIYS